ncbi:MAG: VOC family protein, partial [Brevibacterium aurantiacum]|nr:VOC family protein [Brevibacterium aurantiacum]
HYWTSLAAVPESEQCGWLKDKYGLSWQIVPANLGELMTGDAQIKALMGMKKIVIEDLINAG